MRTILYPHDLETQRLVQERLKEYMAAVDQNGRAAEEWLAANANRIVFHCQQLNRALNREDEGLACAALDNMGEVAGVVLDLQDFTARAENIFGARNSFAKKAEQIPRGIPASILLPLPELPEEAVLDILDIAPPLPQKNKNPGFISGLLHKEELQKESKINEMYRQWHSTRADILGLQGERHYYIDSLMDWTAGTLSQEKDDAPESVMLAYQDPRYMAQRAEESFRQETQKKIRPIAKAAAQYGRLADTIDNDRAKDFLAQIPDLYAADSGPADLLKVLFHDYNVRTLPELVLYNFSGEERQKALLRRLQREIPAAFPQQKKEDVFTMVSRKLEKKLKRLIYSSYK